MTSVFVRVCFHAPTPPVLHTYSINICPKKSHRAAERRSILRSTYFLIWAVYHHFASLSQADSSPLLWREKRYRENLLNHSLMKTLASLSLQELREARFVKGSRRDEGNTYWFLGNIWTSAFTVIHGCHSVCWWSLNPDRTKSSVTTLHWIRAAALKSVTIITSRNSVHCSKRVFFALFFSPVSAGRAIASRPSTREEFFLCTDLMRLAFWTSLFVRTVKTHYRLKANALSDWLVLTWKRRRKEWGENVDSQIQ